MQVSMLHKKLFLILPYCFCAFRISSGFDPFLTATLCKGRKMHVEQLNQNNYDTPSLIPNSIYLFNDALNIFN